MGETTCASTHVTVLCIWQGLWCEKTEDSFKITLVIYDPTLQHSLRLYMSKSKLHKERDWSCVWKLAKMDNEGMKRSQCRTGVRHLKNLNSYHAVRTQDLVLNIPTCVGKQCEGGKALTVEMQKAANCQDSSTFISSPASQGWAGGSEADTSLPGLATLHLALEKRLLSGLPAFFRKTNSTLYNRAQDKRQLLTFLYI